jgi:iron complex outermembrane receptor protein
MHAMTKQVLSAAAAAAFLVTAAPPSLAAELEEVVVTARKQEESLQDTPISITAFTAEDIESRGLSNLSEIGQITPNLTFDFADANSATSNSAMINIRGIGASDWTLTVDPGVGLYVDGVYMSRSVGGVLDLLDFERVEVLRGPQGTLFGKNTIGGAINITTIKPSTEGFFGKAEITTGSYDRIDFRGNVNVPLAANLAASATVSVRNRDGYVENLAPGGTDLGDEDSVSGRVALRWTPTDSLTFDLSADYTRERENPAPNVTIAIDDTNPAGLAFLYNAFFSGDPSCADIGNPARFGNPRCFNSQWVADDPFETYKVFIDVPAVTVPLGKQLKPEANLDLWGVHLTGEWAINDNLTARSITAFRKTEDGYWARTTSVPNIPFGQTVNTWEQEQFSQEIQLLGSSFEGRLDWIAGFYLLEEDGCHLDVAIITGITLYTDNCVDNTSKAVFGQATWHVTDRLSLTGGLRYTDEEKEFRPDSYVYFGSILAPPGLRLVPLTTAKLDSEEVTPYVNVSYQWSDDLMTYASYSEGFKAGGFTQRIFPPFLEVPTFEPEFATVYEVGFKSTLFDRRARLNGAFFYTDYEDLQINVAAPTANVGGLGAVGVITRNAAEAEIYGGELELLVVPAEAWQITGGVGYLHASYEKIDPAAVAISKNNKLVNAPRWSLNLGIEYTHSLGSHGVLIPRLFYSYTSTVYNNPENDPLLTQDPVNLLDASLTWRDEADLWSLTLAGRNLADETYIVDGINDIGNGFIDATFAMPRTWSLTLRRNF